MHQKWLVLRTILRSQSHVGFWSLVNPLQISHQIGYSRFALWLSQEQDANCASFDDELDYTDHQSPDTGATFRVGITIPNHSPIDNPDEVSD